MAPKAAVIAANHRSLVGPEGRAFEHLGEGCQCQGNAGDKPPLEIQQAEELLELLNDCRQQVVVKGLQLGGKGADAAAFDLVAQKLHSGPGESAFGQVEYETSLLEPLKNLLKVKKIFLGVPDGRQDVVNVASSETSFLCF